MIHYRYEENETSARGVIGCRSRNWQSTVCEFRHESEC